MRRREKHQSRAIETGWDGEPDIWQRLSRLLLTVLFLLVMGAILSLFWPQIERQRSLDGDLEKLAMLRDATLGRKDRLAMGLEWLRNDPVFLETVARDRLDLHHEGEFIIRIERPGRDLDVKLPGQ